MGKLIFVVVAVLAYGVVGSMALTDATMSLNHQCEMYELWQLSSGDLGWPDYTGQCEHLTLSQKEGN